MVGDRIKHTTVLKSDTPDTIGLEKGPTNLNRVEDLFRLTLCLKIRFFAFEGETYESTSTRRSVVSFIIPDSHVYNEALECESTSEYFTCQKKISVECICYCSQVLFMGNQSSIIISW
jgi:hypothetical protein